jgi:ABC-type nitrate/sulfonate/bicarbonate transport system permease component
MIARGFRRAALFVVALLCVAALWELYKSFGPEEGGEIFGWRLIPRASDRAMPHTWEMWQRLFDPEVRGRDTPIWRAVLGYSWYTFRMALVGLLLGGIFGVSLAVVMARFKVIERGLLPYVIASQTIPLIALAPQVAAFGGNWDRTVEISQNTPNLEGTTVLTAAPTDGAYTNDIVEAAWALLGDGADLTGDGFAPIEVTLTEGGE